MRPPCSCTLGRGPGLALTGVAFEVPAWPQCNHLSVSGTALTAGADLVVNSGSSFYTSVPSLSATAAVVCYKDYGNSNYGTVAGAGSNPHPLCALPAPARSAEAPALL